MTVLVRLRGLTALSVMGLSITALLVSNGFAATIIAEYDSGSGVPSDPTSQGWTATQVIEAGDPTPPLATAVNTSGDGSLANVGAGATGWLVRDYLDGQSNGQDDRPEYSQPVSASDFALMQNGWKFTATIKMDHVTLSQEMRLFSLDQGGGDYLPFDIKVGLRYSDSGNSSSNLSLRIPIEDGGGAGTGTLFDTGFPAEQFNTVVLEDVDGDGVFTIAVNGTPLLNTADNNSLLFDSTPSGGDVPGDDVVIFGANSTGGDGGGVEYDLVRFEAVPEPGSLALIFFGMCGVVSTRIRR